MVKILLFLGKVPTLGNDPGLTDPYWELQGLFAQHKNLLSWLNAQQYLSMNIE